jgi:hypothetical protein
VAKKVVLPRKKKFCPVEFELKNENARCSSVVNAFALCANAKVNSTSATFCARVVYDEAKSRGMSRGQILALLPESQQHTFFGTNGLLS